MLLLQVIIKIKLDKFNKQGLELSETYFREEYMFFNQTLLLTGLQNRSEETGISKGDLVSLGCYAITKTEPDKLLRIFAAVKVSPVEKAR